MPVWSWSELSAGRHIHGLREDEILPLYEKWGGTARYVLHLARNTSAQREFEWALLAASLDAIYNSLCNVHSADEVGWGCLTSFVPPCAGDS